MLVWQGLEGWRGGGLFGGELQTEDKACNQRTGAPGIQVRRCEYQLTAGLGTKISGKSLAGWHWGEADVKGKAVLMAAESEQGVCKHTEPQTRKS